MIDASKWPDVKWDNRGFEATINGKACSATAYGRYFFANVDAQIIGLFRDYFRAREACEAYAAGLVTLAKAKRMPGWVRG